MAGNFCDGWTGGIMMDEGDFGDASDVAKDVFFLECQHWMRKEFVERVCAASAKQDDRTLFTLRLEATYQLAEFLYLLWAQGIKSFSQMQTLTELHNDHIVDLTKDQTKMERLGLSRERLLEAMFTVDTLPRLLENWRERPGVIDQSNLARFLATVMSAETCRKVAVACTNAGFLSRERTPYGTILVSSQGILERLLGACAREARIRAGGGAIAQ
jgi:hypothetical protein